MYCRAVTREELLNGRYMRYLKDDLRHMLRVKLKINGYIRYTTHRRRGYSNLFVIQAQWKSK